MSGVPTFIYDGDCAFCTSCARFVERRVPTAARVLPWQFADLKGLGLTLEQCEEAVQWVQPPARPAAGPAAIARLLRTSSALPSAPVPDHPVPTMGRRCAAAGWRLAGRMLGLPPVLAIAWPAYRWVARNRHRMPGGTAACAVPPAARRPGASGPRPEPPADSPQ